MNDKAMTYMINKMDEKLKELMSEEEYLAFTRQISTEAFRIEVNSMENGEFKDFVLQVLTRL